MSENRDRECVSGEEGVSQLEAAYDTVEYLDLRISHSLEVVVEDSESEKEDEGKEKENEVEEDVKEQEDAKAGDDSGVNQDIFTSETLEEISVEESVGELSGKELLSNTTAETDRKKLFTISDSEDELQEEEVPEMPKGFVVAADERNREEASPDRVDGLPEGLIKPVPRMRRQTNVDDGDDDGISDVAGSTGEGEEDNVSESSKRIVMIPEEDRKVLTEFDDSDDDVADLAAKLKSLDTEGFTEKTKVPKADLKVKESPFSSLPQEEAKRFIRSASSDAPPLKKNYSSPNVIKTPDTPGVHVSDRPFSYISGQDFQKISPTHGVREAVISRESMNNESVEEMTLYSVDSQTLASSLATSSSQPGNLSSISETVTTQPRPTDLTATRSTYSYRSHTSHVPEKKKFSWRDCFINCCKK